MIAQQLRKVGNSYVVTIPKDEVERRGWQEGQLLREAIEERWERNEEALRYLASR